MIMIVITYLILPLMFKTLKEGRYLVMLIIIPSTILEVYE